MTETDGAETARDGGRTTAPAAAAVTALRTDDGAPGAFGRRLLTAVAPLVGAAGGFLCRRDADGAWTVAETAAAADGTAPPEAPAATVLDALCAAAVRDGLAQARAREGGNATVAVALEGEAEAAISPEAAAPEAPVVAVFPGVPLGSAVRGADHAATVLRLVADLPATRERNRRAADEARRRARLARVLDLVVDLNGARHATEAAMTLCNELAARPGAARVSLARCTGHSVRLVAVSNLDRIHRRMNLVRTLEAVMEEAADQDGEVRVPAPEDSLAITRDHEALADTAGRAGVVSLPLRLAGRVAWVMTLERADGPFPGEALEDLRLVADLAARRLEDLRLMDRWIGTQVAASAGRGLRTLVGPEHAGAKVAGLVALAGVAYLAFGTWSYRVEAPFTVRTETMRVVNAPYDGYIAESWVRKGDVVQPGDRLMALDTARLKMRKAEVMATITRHLVTASKAKSEGRLARMRSARAQVREARVKRQRIQYKLDRATLEAPLEGVVVEGDPGQRVGSAVRKGEVLFKLASIHHLYAEIRVPESRINDVRQGASGEVAFRTRPEQTYPVEVETILPAAKAQKGRNIFHVWARFTGGEAGWWRPGMSGQARIAVGERNVFWVLAHSTIDFLRMFLWL